MSSYTGRYTGSKGERLVFLLGVFALAFSASGLGATVEIAADFDPEKHLITGSQWVSWEEPPAEASFFLLANLGREKNPYLSGRALDEIYAWGFDPAWTKIDGVFWETPGGTRELPYQLLPAPPTLQTYSLEDVFLKVSLPGGEGRLRIDFRTRFPHVLVGEPGRLGDVYTWRFGWHPIPAQLPQGDRWPFLLSAHDYSLELTVPEGWEAALPGQVEEVAGEGRRLYRVSFPTPVRSITLFIGPEEELGRVSLPLEGLFLEAVALPGDEDKLRQLATYIPEILSHYGSRFGPYPYRRLLLVEHPNQVGVAFAADGVVFIPKWFFDRLNITAEGMLSRYGQFALAHELAHQWWGVGVGVDLDAENWLSEGLAQYAAVSWYEERYGAEGGNVFLFENKGLGEAMAESAVGFVNLREHLIELPYLQMAFQGFDEAVVKPLAELDYAQASSVRLYDKGYLVFRALAHLVGEDLFDQVLSEVAGRFRGGNLTVEELKLILEERSGMDLVGFFTSWVWGEARADYGIERVLRRQGEEGYVTEVHLFRKGTGFLPVEVEAQGPEGESMSQTWPSGEAPREILVFETTFPVVRVVVDPGHYVLDEDRLNNVWPPRFVFVTTENELPLDGYLVYANPNSRAVQVQYLDRFGWAIYPEELAVEGFVSYGRQATVWGFARVKGTLIGAISLTRHLWDTPPTGDPGTYWESVGDFTVSFSRRPYPVIGVGLSWQASLTSTYSEGLSLLVVPGKGGRLYLEHTQGLSLFPRTYLDLTFGLGIASPGLPDELHFGLSELHTLEDGPWGERKLFLEARVSLPSGQGDYSLAGMALASGITPYIYLSWGGVWTEGASSGKMGPYSEVGGGIEFRLELFGGLLALPGVVGVAWPLPQGEGVFFFELGS